MSLWRKAKSCEDPSGDAYAARSQRARECLSTGCRYAARQTTGVAAIVLTGRGKW